MVITIQIKSLGTFSCLGVLTDIALQHKMPIETVGKIVNIISYTSTKLEKEELEMEKEFCTKHNISLIEEK